MPTRRRTVKAPAKKNRRPDKLLPATLLGLTAALMFAAVGLQYAFAPLLPTTEVAAPPTPEAANVLPAGAQAADGSVIYIADPVSRVFAAGYALDGTANIGLIVWDRLRNRYALGADLALAADGFRMIGSPSIRPDAVSAGGPNLIIAHGAVEGGFRGSAVLIRNGTASLVFADRTDAYGVATPAVFAEGLAARPDESVEFVDVDGDGKKEIIVTVATRGKKIASAYSWNGSAFAYNPDLSWALDLRGTLFPEP